MNAAEYLSLAWRSSPFARQHGEPIPIRKLSERQLRQMKETIGNGLGGGGQALQDAGYSQSDIASYFEAVKNA